MSVMRPSAVDSSAEEALTRHQEEIERYLMRHLRNAEDVRDLGQEVYLRFLRVGNFEEIVEPLKYLYSTARHAVIEFRMRRRRERELVEFDSKTVDHQSETLGNGARDEAERLSEERSLKRALDRLPPLYRDIVLLYACDGRDYAEIGERLDLSSHTVKKYYFRAMAALRLDEELTGCKQGSGLKL